MPTLEELAPSTAKLTKQTGYDTLDPDEVLEFIRFALREYSKAYEPYKISSRPYGKTKFQTKWKIRHDGKHVGDIVLKTKTPGVGLGYGISDYVAKLKDKKKRDFYSVHFRTGNVYMVLLTLKMRMDSKFWVGEFWIARGIPTSLGTRKQWYDTYQLIKEQHDRKKSDYLDGETSNLDVFDKSMLEFLKSEGVTYGIRTLKKIWKKGNDGLLDHMKDYKPLT